MQFIRLPAAGRASGNWRIDPDGKLVVKEVQSEKLCLGGTCVTEDELKALLLQGGIAPANDKFPRLRQGFGGQAISNFQSNPNDSISNNENTETASSTEPVTTRSQPTTTSTPASLDASQGGPIVVTESIAATSTAGTATSTAIDNGG